MKTIQSLFLPIFLTSIIAFLLSSCVSKKKYLSEVDLRSNCDSTLQMINSRNLALNREIARLKLDLATQEGRSGAFRELLDKQDEQINRLEDEIESLSNQTLDQQALMDGALQQKTREVVRRKAQLQSFKDDIAQQEEQLKTIIARIGNELIGINEEELGLKIKKGSAYIRLSESLIFRRGSTRLNSKALDILDPIGAILMDYPAMNITVLGHTDNKPGKTDNWDLSTLRATAVVKALTKDVGMAPNQIVAAGKGEFKPVSSNETEEGRALNRRTEIIITPASEKILQKIKEAN